MSVKPFRVEFPAEDIAAFKKRIKDAALPPHAPEDKDSWRYGADMDFMIKARRWWTEDFVWESVADKLNAHKHVMVDTDGVKVHAMLEPATRGDEAPTLLITHGWPGSVVEFLDAAPRLAHPERFGGREEDGVNVIAPSLPGFAFSPAPRRPIGPRDVADLWAKLMPAMGINSYYAQGGDWGAMISGLLALRHGSDKGGGCLGAHMNMAGLIPEIPRDPSQEVVAWIKATESFREDGSGYMRIQSTRPQSLAFAMADSPFGVAAWIAEKFRAWTDRRSGDVFGSVSMENVFINISLYVLTRCFGSATWIYAGRRDEGRSAVSPDNTVKIPIGVAAYPGEILRFPPRELMERGYENIIHWSTPKQGGHFAAMENPAEFADDVLSFVAKAKSS